MKFALIVVTLISLYYIDALLPNITANYWHGVACVSAMLVGEWVCWLGAASISEQRKALPPLLD